MRLLGDYAGGVGNDGAELHFVNAHPMTGTWTEWRDPSLTFYLWSTATHTRAGACPRQPRMAPPQQAREETRNPVGGQ